MPAEAAFSITAKTPQGDLATVRGDDSATFTQNIYDHFGHAAEAILARFASAFGATAPTPQQAVQNVVQQFPAAQPVSTVGQPLPQPGAVAHPAAAAPVGALPNVPYPGDCAHGPRAWKDTLARGKQWQRWECALPWVKGNDAHNASRCPNVNV